jgi:hypothetical protein
MTVVNSPTLLGFSNDIMIVRSETSTSRDIADFLQNPKRFQTMPYSQYQPNGFDQSTEQYSYYGAPRVSVDGSWSSEGSII